jgi:hypothetical protein
MHQIIKQGASNPAYLTGEARGAYVEAMKPMIEGIIPHSSRVSIVNGFRYSRVKTFNIRVTHQAADVSPNLAPMEWKYSNGDALEFESDFGLTQEIIDHYEKIEQEIMEG